MHPTTPSPEYKRRKMSNGKIAILAEPRQFTHDLAAPSQAMNRAFANASPAAKEQPLQYASATSYGRPYPLPLGQAGSTFHSYDSQAFIGPNGSPVQAPMADAYDEETQHFRDVHDGSPINVVDVEGVDEQLTDGEASASQDADPAFPVGHAGRGAASVATRRTRISDAGERGVGPFGDQGGCVGQDRRVWPPGFERDLETIALMKSDKISPDVVRKFFADYSNVIEYPDPPKRGGGTGTPIDSNWKCQIRDCKGAGRRGAVTAKQHVDNYHMPPRYEYGGRFFRPPNYSRLELSQEEKEAVTDHFKNTNFEHACYELVWEKCFPGTKDTGGFYSRKR
ncbi:unnamed protein product, partial [Mesorhabditis spiculigera]